MADLNELYQQVILDHNKKPRNFRPLDAPSLTQEGHNPLCGDHITLQLELDGDTIKDVGFQGSGCAISKASSSMMTTAVKGKTRAEVEVMADEFVKMVRGELDPETEENHLGRLKIFAGVKEFPARVKCAALSWRTVQAAISEEHSAVSTE
ncbi:MAG: SUF system NifU family Fe-S cluster assembly protein [Blastocatellia bacterium]